MTSPSFLANLAAEELVSEDPAVSAKPAEVPGDIIGRKLTLYYNEMAQTPDLKDDFVANMRGFQNNMSPHMYNSGALPLWEKVIADERYYPVRSDEEIIRVHAERIRELTSGAKILVEQGMGDSHAIEHKTLAVFDLIGAEKIVGMDFSDAALMNSNLTITQLRPELDGKFKATHRNFNKQSFRIGETGKKVITQLGLTIGNNPNRDLSGILRHYRNQMNVGDIMIFSVDRNMDEVSLHRAYNDIFGVWVDDMRRYLAVELGMMGYKPQDFEYARVWNRDTTSFHFGFRALRDGHVMNGEKCMHYRKGQKFWYLPSRRYRQSTLDGYYKKAGGFQLLDVLPDNRNYVSWQVLKAVPRPAV